MVRDEVKLRAGKTRGKLWIEFRSNDDRNIMDFSGFQILIYLCLPLGEGGPERWMRQTAKSEITSSVSTSQCEVFDTFPKGKANVVPALVGGATGVCP